MDNLTTKTKNTISKLQEFCQKRRWDYPNYNFEPELTGFKCSATLKTISSKGFGDSKKNAKNEAAKALYKIVRDKYPEEPDENSTTDFLISKMKERFEILKFTKLKLIDDETNDIVRKFCITLRNKKGKTLASLESIQLNNKITNLRQLLEEICDEQNFTIKYFDINENTISGKFQCLLKILIEDSNPIIVCHGFGITKQESYTNASYNTLQYLKIMMKKTDINA